MTDATRISRLPGPLAATRDCFRDHPGPGRFFLLGAGLLLAAATVRQNGRAVGYFLMYLGTVPATCWVGARVGFSRPAWWALATLGVLHGIGGLVPSPQDVPVFYETWLIAETLKFDQLVHGIGGAVLGLVGWQLVGSVAEDTADRGILAIGAVLIANGVGALNEVVEFMIDRQAFESYVGGLANAGWDMTFNLVGSLVAVVVLLARDRTDSTPVAT